ncbi:DUF1592 domain-containing protein [Vitiosangium sp. GDMCC 1.1324]|uniref:DUF1592 domain-containing protein n=1 Tax=Vitiosangium sp. (strain GDMCC 1.1324) TaxID=2138576 RepID=UPI000D35B53B|nr:DUF1592 domain-containing protein [Vitiosangium sp. GDMCC 1.1324]PTL80639.1 hypothetical protein DAT35_28865 [Vitiosangium sp. GDMCC 1.1324]
MLNSRHLTALGALFFSAVLLSACSKSDTGGCPDDLEFFRSRMWEPVMSTQCIACHKSDGLAAGTRMVLLPPSEPGAVESNFMTVRAMAREKVDGVPLLLLKPSGMHPQGHGGGTLVAQGSTRYVDFQRFTDRINGVEGACEASPVVACQPNALDPSAKRRIRMLTRFEYDNTLRDLLYLDSSWGQSLPAEEVVNGFDNNADARAVGQLLTDKLLSAAEQAAEAAMANLSRHVSCAPGDACAQQFIQDFGLRAFRRPLTDAERTRYQSLYTSVALEDGYTGGIKAIITAMLQSPNFLYRTELGQHLGDGRYALTDYEIASELSYLFWGSMPDETLFAKASAGALHLPEQISVEARRMLAAPRSRPMLEHFVSQWLDLEKLNQAQKDAIAFSDFSPTIRAAMKAETTEFFDYIVRNSSGQLQELFSADYTFASDGLAMFYRLPSGPVSSSTAAASSGLRMWELTGSGRGGILTQGSILAAQSTPQTSSPVRRGKLIRERMLCQPLPPPPPGLNVQLSPVDEQLPNRGRFQEHSSNPACASCHKLMDPIGFGFEQFDSVGRFQPEQNGNPVDASGEVLSSSATNGTFNGVDELQQKLAQSPDVHACFSKQWLRFGYGVSGDDEACVSRQLTDTFRQQGLSIPELVISLTQLPRFTQRLGDTSGTVDPGPGTGGNTGGGNTGGGNTGGGTGTPPPTSSNAQISISVQDDWGTGYCHNVKVTNSGTAPLVWTVTLTIEGTFTHAWSANSTHSGNQSTFTGLDWNDELEPGESTSFGFCATR